MQRVAPIVVEILLSLCHIIHISHAKALSKSLTLCIDAGASHLVSVVKRRHGRLLEAVGLVTSREDELSVKGGGDACCAVDVVVDVAIEARPMNGGCARVHCEAATVAVAAGGEKTGAVVVSHVAHVGRRDGGRG